jgi:hypothetical protein
MYGWLYNTFGTTPFTIDDFKMNFPSQQPTKVIFDLIKLEFIRRKKHGTYQIIKPEEFVQNIIRESSTKTDVVTQATKPYAYAQSTAVNIWTDGYYWTDFTKGFKPIHINVVQKDVPYWKTFFNHHDAEYVIEGEHRTLFGVMYVVHPKETVTVETKHDKPVVPLQEIVQYCQSNSIIYRPALEYLDKKYHLHLFKNYESTAS